MYTNLENLKLSQEKEFKEAIRKNDLAQQWALHTKLTSLESFKPEYIHLHYACPMLCFEKYPNHLTIEQLITLVDGVPPKDPVYKVKNDSFTTIKFQSEVDFSDVTEPFAPFQMHVQHNNNFIKWIFHLNDVPIICRASFTSHKLRARGVRRKQHALSKIDHWEVAHPWQEYNPDITKFWTSDVTTRSNDFVMLFRQPESMHPTDFLVKLLRSLL